MRSTLVTVPLLILVSLGSIRIQAQESLFTRVIYDSNNGLSTYATSIAPDNGIYCAGFNYTNSGFIFRTDAAGLNVWSKSISADNAQVILTDVKTLPDSTFITSGLIQKQDQCYILILKWSSSGDTLWSRVLPLEGCSYVTRINTAENDTFIVSGSTVTYGDENITKAYAVCADYNGNLHWGSYYTGSGLGIYANSVAVLPDGNFEIAGYYYLNEQAWVEHWLSIRTDQNGNLIRALSMPGEINYNLNRAYDLLAIDDGVVYYSQVSGCGLLKLSYSDELMWARKYGFSNYSLYTEMKGKLIRTRDHGFAVNSSDYMCITNESGIPQKSYNIFMDVTDFNQRQDSGFIFSGNGPLLGVLTFPQYIPHIGLYTIDSDGNSLDCIYDGFIQWEDFIPEFDSIEVQQSSMEPFSQLPLQIDLYELGNDSSCVAMIGKTELNLTPENSVKVWPNPASEFIRVEIGALQSRQSAGMDIFNACGTKVWSGNITTSESRLINISPFAPGIYFIVCNVQDQLVTTKFIRE